ncbi:MAG: PPC domain-containing protein [Anaerolineae bacterium]|nr:PPC domain-containing protein [Anaerolineae bacterium]
MIHRLLSAHIGRRLIIAMIMLALIAVGISGSGAVLAQTSRRLQYGQNVTGTFDAQAFAQVYSFNAARGDVVSVTATSQTDGLTLGVVLTDSTGETVASSEGSTNAEVNLSNVEIATAGTYYITVVGSGAATEGTFTLGLAGQTATSAPESVDVSGVNVTLNWSSNDDFNLEVRDPQGGAVNFRTPTVNSGGALQGNVNGECSNATANSPTETISWPAGSVPGGSYEVLVYFNQACTTPAQPRQFTLTISVNGQDLAPIQGTLQQGQQYVTSFVIAGADNVTIGNGGDPVEAALNLIAFRDLILAPSALTNNQGTGTINSQNPAEAWSFQGTANEIVTIDLAATSGSLDTFLILIGPDGIPVASNDDANADTRNSQILNKQLTADGRYVILATRFGLGIGGTEGGYSVTLTSGSQSVGAGTPVATANPGTATGGTTVAQDTDGDGLPDGSIEVLLRWDTRADMRVLIRDPQGRVLYADNPNPIDGGVLYQQGNFNCANTVTNPQTYAYFPGTRPIDGTYEVQVWVFNDCNSQIQPNFSLTMSANNQQFFTTTARPDFSVRKNHYVVAFTVSNGTAVAGEGGTFYGDFGLDIGSIADQMATATLLEYGRPVQGEISATSPFVVYTFNANAGNNIQITERATRGTLDTFLYLLDPNGNPITQNDDVTPGRDTNSQIQYTIPATGQYYIVASRYGVRYGGTLGSYELALSLR